MRGGPSIKHLDDVPAEEMLRLEFSDGRTASIWEKWIELSPRYFAFWNKWGDVFGPWEAGPNGCDAWGTVCSAPDAQTPAAVDSRQAWRRLHIVGHPMEYLRLTSQ
jgi:hypothetical protein